jgi:hypothetical protein
MESADNVKSLNNLYSALINEERQAKPVAGTTIRLMAEKPFELGKTVGKLLKSRFLIRDAKLIQRVARLKIILVELEKSYLVIRLDFPALLAQAKNHGPAFSRFFKGIHLSMGEPDFEPLVRRLPPVC